jgi:cytidylate kinase
MNVITMSREYGAGGGELARLLASSLGWELLDQELLHQAAQIEHLLDAELERLDEQAVGMAERFRLHPPHRQYLHALREASHAAVARGRVVLVGRGTRQLLGDTPSALHVRLVAPREWRAARMARLEGWNREEALSRCDAVERSRVRFLQYFFGADATAPEQYDLVVNTGRVPLEEAADGVIALIRGATSRMSAPAGHGGSVLTMTGQAGAANPRDAALLAGRLGLQLWHRELLDREAVRLGLSAADVERIDEQPAGIFERFLPGSVHHRCLAVLRELMEELGAQGQVLIVGRGSSCFLRDHPRAFHARVVAPLADRVRCIMTRDWAHENVARKRIEKIDSQRRRFFAECGGGNWDDPLGYHLTINTARLGERSEGTIADFALRRWQRAAQAAG